MDSKQYNERRYNRKKQWYRIVLGIQQLINYPAINLIWLLFVVGVFVLAKGEEKLISTFIVSPSLAFIFMGCMHFLFILFLIICAIGIIQTIGYITAMKDEADLSLVFYGNRQIVTNEPPILIYKKKDRKNGVTKRECYTTIPMERWQERKEAICDRMDIHLIGDITYGGKKKNKGNHIYFESAKGRKPKERGALYDDTF